MISIEEQATGCRGAHGYREFANSRGFNFVEVLDWTSSAGDWQFLVSKDGRWWQILCQTNNYPRAGFSYALDDEIWEGTAEQVSNAIHEQF